MRIGRLRRRVRLEHDVPAIDAVDGAEIEQWVTVASVFGELLDLRGQEYIAAQETHASVTSKITIRYRTDVEPLRWRAVIDGITYNVLHVVDLAGRRQYLELLVERIS